MKNLVDYTSFINESSKFGANVDLPKFVIDHLTRQIGKSLFSVVVGDKKLSRIFLDDPDKEGISKIFIVWNEKLIGIPGIRVDVENQVISSNAAETKPKFLEKFGEFLVAANIIDSNWELSRRTDLSSEDITKYFILPGIFNALRSNSLKSQSYFNPFENNINNNAWIKKLKTLGVVLDSNLSQQKKGIIVLGFSGEGWRILIYPNGYIRSSFGGRTNMLTQKAELIAPVYSENDLDIKLAYVYVYFLKYLLQSAGVSSNEIKEIVRSFTQSNKIDIKGLVDKFPFLANILIDTENEIDSDLKKGVALLGRLGSLF